MANASPESAGDVTESPIILAQSTTNLGQVSIPLGTISLDLSVIGAGAH
jgi:hypothetical protein